MAGYHRRYRSHLSRARTPLSRFALQEPDAAFRNLGHGHFEELFDEAGTAILEPHSSRGIAYGDFDNDGDIDMLVVNLGEPPSLFRNDVSGKNHWIKIGWRAQSPIVRRSARALK
jgi:hypothetical protein